MLVRAQEFSRPLPVPARDLELPGFEVRHATRHKFALRLWGPLAPAWAASLGVGLYEAGIRVVRGQARRAPGGPWLAEFELEALDDSEEPVLIDYLGLASRPVSELSPPPAWLGSHHRSLTAKHGGSLFLEVRASDRIGFLGGLLARIAGVGLAPVELEIDTHGIPVLDRFFLKGLDGQAPGRDERRALALMLDQLSSLAAALGAIDLKTFGLQPFAQQPEHGRVVIDEQDFVFFRWHWEVRRRVVSQEGYVENRPTRLQ